MITPESAAFLSPPQVADLLGIGHDKVLQFIRTGELAAANLATSLGGRPRWRISREDLEVFLRQRSVVASKAVPQRRRKQQTNVIEFYR